MIRNLFSFSQFCFALLAASALLLASCGTDDSIAPIDPTSTAILSLEPATGRSGQVVQIKGQNFGTSAAYLQVFFNGESARVLQVTEGEITVVVPSTATTGRVKVILEDASAESRTDFTVDNSEAIILDGSPRQGAVSFVIDGKAYMGTGRVSAATIINDFWRFDPATKSWTRLADVPGPGRGSAFSFVINNVGYVGGGDAGGDTHNMYAYDIATDTWTEKSPYPPDSRNIHAIAATINGKAYVGFGGTNFSASASFYEYDPATDVWTYLQGYPGPERRGSVSFVINNKLYMGLGADGEMLAQSLKDFYSYDPATNTWTQLADFPGEGKYKAVSFAIGNKAYVGTGLEYVDGETRVSNDMWAYDAASDTWTQVQNYGGSPRFGMSAFVVGEDAYLGFGDDRASVYKDFWVFRP